MQENSNRCIYREAHTALSFCTALEIDRKEVVLPSTPEHKIILDRGEALLALEHSGNALEITLSFTNTSPEPLHIGRMILLRSSDLTLGDTPSTDWYIFRQGRMKNDLPAVCRLGDMGDAFTDARATLRESGGGTENTDTSPLLVSDSMTLLSAGEETGKNLLMTFETGDRLLTETLVELTPEHAFKELECACLANILLPPGETIRSETLRLDAPADAVEAIDSYASRKAALYHARQTQSIPSVYCTWYYYGLTVSESDVTENLAGLRRRRIPFDVFQIDEGWERCLGDWRSNEKFPSGMKLLAERIRSAGMIPGIWTSPFIAHETAPITSEHPEWFLKHPDGSWCLFPMNGTVYRVLDITHPDAVAWAAELYRRLREWGYRYHKLDFTRAAVLYPDAPRYNPSLPIAAAYRQAVLALREQMGDDAYFLMCGGLYDPLIGIVDAQRTGSDVLSMWSAKVGKGGGKTAPFTIKQNLLRYWMHPWWNADPDALMIRRQKEPFRGLNLTLGLLNETEVQTSALNQFMGCGLACSTEPMSTIEDDRLFVLRHVLPVLPGIPHPRGLMNGDRYPSCVDLAYTAYHMVCLINWSDTQSIPCRLRLDSSVLGEFAHSTQEFTVCSFWDQTYTEHVPAGTEVTMGSIPPHGTALLKILPQSSSPAVLISTSHFSMGAELQCLEVHDQQLHFVLDQQFPCPVRYGIRLPEGTHPALLPEHTSCIGSLLEIYIPTPGHYDIRVPLVIE